MGINPGKWLLAGVLVAPVLAGCVVSQTRSGEYQFGFIDPGSTTVQFQSANGLTRLRRHFDGTWGLRFSDQLTVYKMGRYDDIRLVSEHTVGGKTAALFQRRRGNCIDYELLTIANGTVLANRIQPGCSTPLEVGLVGDQLVMREAAGNRPRFWVWSVDGLRRGREPSRPRAAVQPAPAPSRPAVVARQGSPRNAVEPPVARPASAPPPAPNRAQVVLPSGSIPTEAMVPTRVVLEHDGGT